MLKDMDSKWEPSDRSGKWMKLKPDYIHSESDLDVLIIGQYPSPLFDKFVFRYRQDSKASRKQPKEYYDAFSVTLWCMDKMIMLYISCFSKK